MSNRRKGNVIGCHGDLVKVTFDDYVIQNEVAYVLVNEERLKSEVIRVQGQQAEMQVFESTSGIKVGDAVEFTGELLSVELGPGLLGQVVDGLQNPLYNLAEKLGFFLHRGNYLDPLPDDSEWEFTPEVKPGDKIRAGMKVGTVPEKIFKHWIMVPFNFTGLGEVVEVSPKGSYKLKDTVAKVRDANGKEIPVTMSQHWPVKVPIEAYARKLQPVDPMVSKIRIIDTIVPVALGGTFCTPGPFGSGKTVLQHLLSRHAEVDIVVVAACGERAGEVVELLKEFPKLKDPRTGKTLMDRTIIICNTSSMPVAARESSVYTAVTLAEYYRQMGLNVFCLADSTSRWAQAMREISARLEEIPGEEAYPAYLETRIASFYERAGLIQAYSGEKGSVTIGGAVSPAGGNFEEPVTQATLKVVGAFHGLSKTRADARRYPAIDPLESWSKYPSFIARDKIQSAMRVLRRSNEIGQMMKVVGEEGTSIEDFVAHLKGEFLDAVYLQQNAYDKVDEATSDERQRYVFDVVLEILEGSFRFEDKETARRFFLNLRQQFITWNTLEFKKDEFNELERKIRSRYESGAKA